MDDQFLLVFNNVNTMLDILKKYETVHVFFDESINAEQQKLLIDTLNKSLSTITTVIAPCFATQKVADNLIYRQEDFVIAVGKLHIQSLIKYYAYANNINYAIIPVHEIAEYSFCKYAYLKDVNFCFYLCNKPSFAFINENFFSNEDVIKLRKILSYKNIVLYEKECEELLLEQKAYNLKNIVKNINKCGAEKQDVIKLYAAISLKLEDTNTFSILGNEYTVLSLLCLNKKDVTDNLISATNLLVKFYECFNKFDLIRVSPNINMHIYMLKKQYKYSTFQLRDSVLCRFSNKQLDRIEYKFNAYGPYLKQLLNNQKNCFMHSQIAFTNQELELALALSPSICIQNTMLTVAKELGYFENLLK